MINTLPPGNENSRFIEIYVTDGKREFSFYGIIYDSGAFLHLFYETVSLSITQEKILILSTCRVKAANMEYQFLN